MNDKEKRNSPIFSTCMNNVLSYNVCRAKYRTISFFLIIQPLFPCFFTPLLPSNPIYHQLSHRQCFYLLVALNVDTSGDDVSIHSEWFCMHCKCSMVRSISAIMEWVHHKCTVMLFQWQKHNDLEWKVHCIYRCALCKQIASWCTGM